LVGLNKILSRGSSEAVEPNGRTVAGWALQRLWAQESPRPALAKLGRRAAR
jgi:hypothetical protein